MSVREIKRVSLMNVPGKLRELADSCEKHDLRTAIVIVGYPGGYCAVRGFGEKTSALEAIGWLHRALDALTDGSGVETDFSSMPEPPGAA
jgi:hypothetical protein